MQNSLFLAAALLYAVCALLPSRRGAVISGVTALAWVAHGAALGLDVAEPGQLRVGFAIMLSSALWVSVAAYWLENRNFALDGMRRLVMPFAVAASVLPVVFPGSLLPLSGQSPAFGWHVAVAVLAYSTLTIAAFHAVLMALQEARLHTHAASGGWLGSALDQLPASWGAAIEAFAACPQIKRIFPAHLIENFVMTKRQELRYMAELSDEETVELYLDTV